MGFDATAEGAKKRDYWWTVLATDPVALPAARFLARRRWLTPDQVTALALLTGLSTGVLFATGTRWGLVAGGLVFYGAFVLDCIDGKLARALGVTSPRGEALDHLADGGRRASASLGVALYLSKTDGDILWAIVYAILAYFFLEISGAEKKSAPDGLGGRISHALARRRLLPNPGMPDVQAVVFIVGPITGAVVLALGVGIGMVAAAILLTVYRRLR
ncbi:MAG TPA: CDP-alcohol phosphatidyltransferase family protein [Actinomycetota bacterium]|nr:CDP-alcohol phosphatidyltransferase family protein [Actinomycetota bacterium]